MEKTILIGEDQNGERKMEEVVTGPITLPSIFDFTKLYETQQGFQYLVTKEQHLPTDDLEWFGYHVKAMVEELGELLSADKRWKTHRNVKFEQENKLEELCDVFITAMNLCIFSGIEGNQLYFAIKDKIQKNYQKWRLKNGEQETKTDNC